MGPPHYTRGVTSRTTLLPDLAKASQYRWWPSCRRVTVETSHAKLIPIMWASLGILAGIFFLPVIRQTTNVDPWAVSAVLLGYALWFGFTAYLLPRFLRNGRTAANLTMTGNLVLGIGISVAIPVLSKDPRTPLWAIACVYACFNGVSRGFEPCITFVVAHAIGPLLTIPIFFVLHADPTWSVAGPALASIISLISYAYLANITVVWREELRETEAAAKRWHAKSADLERRRLAQDLHDSVGSALSLVGLYGDVVEEMADQPEELRRVGAILRESAREGLAELRGVLEAVAPESGTLAGLATGLSRIATRAMGIEVQIEMVGDPDLTVPGRTRLAIVRTFQEALHNAVSHGRARHVSVVLHAEPSGQLSITVRDDGSGFEADAPQPQGRGLPGLRARAGELDGTLRVTSTPGLGTEIRLALPSSATDPAAEDPEGKKPPG
jgi:signal transduction histidine kinase